MLKRLTPFITYRDLTSGIGFFKHNLGFKVIYTEGDPLTMAIVERDMVQLFLHHHIEEGDPFEPAYRIEVEQIEQLYEEINDREKNIFHPNSPQIDKKPWGAQEFSVLDPDNGVCITFYEHKKS